MRRSSGAAGVAVPGDFPSTDSPPPPRRGARRALALPAVLLPFCVIAVCLLRTLPLDLFWQIETGRRIAATGHAPMVEVFSWTRYGAPWTAPEWLSCLTAWLAYQAGGFGGVWALYVGLFAVVCTVIWLRAARFIGGWLALAWTVVAANALHPVLQPRPYLVTYIFLPVSVLILSAAARRGASLKYLWLLPPLCALWANLHQGVFSLVAITFYFALVVAGRGLRDRDQRADSLARALRLALVGLICLAATGANPYGYRVLQDALSTITDPTNTGYVQEWLPLYAVPQTAFGWFYVFVALVLALNIAVRRRVPPSTALLLLLLFLEGVAHSRQVALFVLVAAVLMPEPVGQALDAADAGRSGEIDRLRDLLIPVLAIIPLALTVRAVTSTWNDARSAPGPLLERLGETVFSYDMMPVDACRFIESLHVPGSVRLFNSFGVGGFLILAMPDHPIFIDGRSNIYFGNVMEEYRTALQSSSNLDEMLDRDNIQIAVVAAHPEVTYLAADPKWTLAFEDTRTVDGRTYTRGLVFVRKGAGAPAPPP